MPFTPVRRCLVAAILAVCIGCDSVPQMRSTPPPQPETPVVNLPTRLRQTNWVSTRGEGSCVHASSMSHFRWQNRHALAAGWRGRYAGGETAYSILSKWRNNRIPFAYTETGDPQFLEWATATRRGAIIWYFDAHCVTFLGFHSSGDGRQWAVICDNNQTRQFLAIEKQAFIRNWRGRYGGFAATAIFTPAGPLPWPAYLPAE